MAIEITWLGHASFRIAGGGTVLYIDPWKIPRPRRDGDVIFISHSHYDHCSSPDIAKVAKPGAVTVAPTDTLAKLGPGQALVRGMTVTVGRITLEGVAAYNIDKDYHPKTNGWLGVVAGLGDQRIYYAGDTDLVTEMAKLERIDLALLPVGGTYTMDAAAAIEACRQIGCQAAVPYHWGDIVGARSDAEALAAEAPCAVHILSPGESLTL